MKLNHAPLNRSPLNRFWMKIELFIKAFSKTALNLTARQETSDRNISSVSGVTYSKSIRLSTAIRQVLTYGNKINSTANRIGFSYYNLCLWVGKIDALILREVKSNFTVFVYMSFIKAQLNRSAVGFKLLRTISDNIQSFAYRHGNSFRLENAKISVVSLVKRNTVVIRQSLALSKLLYGLKIRSTKTYRYTEGLVKATIAYAKRISHLAPKTLGYLNASTAFAKRLGEAGRLNVGISGSIVSFILRSNNFLRNSFTGTSHTNAGLNRIVVGVGNLLSISKSFFALTLRKSILERSIKLYSALMVAVLIKLKLRFLYRKPIILYGSTDESVFLQAKVGCGLAKTNQDFTIWLGNYKEIKVNVTDEENLFGFDIKWAVSIDTTKNIILEKTIPASDIQDNYFIIKIEPEDTEALPRVNEREYVEFYHEAMIVDEDGKPFTIMTGTMRVVNAILNKNDFK